MREIVTSPTGAPATATETTDLASPRRAAVASSATLTAAILPVFLTGALSPRIGEDFAFGTGVTGAAIAAFFVGAGLAAVPMGHVTDRVGPTAALRAGLVITGLVTLAVAVLAGAWWQVALLLALAGTAVGLVDTGGARLFHEAVPLARHGLAFGSKEASVPAASLLAGLSVPLLAERLGWQVVFVIAASLTPVLWAVVPSRGDSARRAGSADRSSLRGPLVLFAAGLALATAAATAAATLFVPAFGDRGWSEDAAGALLAGASALTIAIRVVAGWLSDRRPAGSWYSVVGLMAGGAAGAAVLAATSARIAGVLGALLVIGIGWGWTGLAFQTAVRITPSAPAMAAGIVVSGLSVGGAFGPATFGAISGRASFAAAWLAAAAGLGLGASAVVAARAWHDRAPRASPSPRGSTA